jgi:hypothetical protein
VSRKREPDFSDLDFDEIGELEDLSYYDRMRLEYGLRLERGGRKKQREAERAEKRSRVLDELSDFGFKH